MHNCRGIHKKKKGAKKKNDYDDEISSDPAEEENQRNPPESVASLRSRSPEWVFTIAGIRNGRPWDRREPLTSHSRHLARGFPDYLDKMCKR